MLEADFAERVEARKHLDGRTEEVVAEETLEVGLNFPGNVFDAVDVTALSSFELKEETRQGRQKTRNDESARKWRRVWKREREKTLTSSSSSESVSGSGSRKDIV